MKSSFILVVTILMLSIAVWFISGCGSNPTGGGGAGSEVSNPNTGTISGYVYKHNDTTGVNTGMAGIILSVSTEAMRMEVSATTDSTGRYTLSGLSNGTVPVTATWEVSSWLEGFTIVANNDTINFVIDYEEDPGTATIRGTLEGISGVPSNYCWIDPYPISGRYFNYDSMYDETTQTYEVTYAPDDGLTYLTADWDDGVQERYAYNKINTNGGGTFDLNISFESEVTLEGVSATPPSGYTMYSASAYIAKDKKALIYAGGKWDPVSSTNGVISRVIPLKSGDSYRISLGAKDSNNEYLTKYFYDRTAGSNQNFQFSSLQTPDPFVKYLIDGGVVTGTPTFEWQSVPGATSYYVDLSGWNVNEFDWWAYTNDNKITLPPSVVSRLVSGESYDLTIRANKYVNDAPIYKMNEISSDRYLDYRLSNYITFTWNQ